MFGLGYVFFLNLICNLFIEFKLMASLGFAALTLLGLVQAQ